MGRGNCYFEHNTDLTSIDLSNLENIKGNIYIQNNPALTTLIIPKIKNIGYDSLYTPLYGEVLIQNNKQDLCTEELRLACIQNNCVNSCACDALRYYKVFDGKCAGAEVAVQVPESTTSYTLASVCSRACLEHNNDGPWQWRINGFAVSEFRFLLDQDDVCLCQWATTNMCEISLQTEYARYGWTAMPRQLATLCEDSYSHDSGNTFGAVITDAERDCASDNLCLGVYDPGCDGRGRYYLCKELYKMEINPGDGDQNYYSCVHKKRECAY